MGGGISPFANTFVPTNNVSASANVLSIFMTYLQQKSRKG